jgi:hypothetical protein
MIWNDDVFRCRGAMEVFERLLACLSAKQELLLKLVAEFGVNCSPIVLLAWIALQVVRVLP